MKPKNQWASAHVRLKRLYEERVPEDISQRKFGRLHDIGSQSMVAQYLNGIRPLNYEVTAKFARALRCTIYDICPEMADSLRDEILPVLGKSLRRAAACLLALGLAQLTPSDAYAQFDNKKITPASFSKSLSLLHIVHLSLRSIARTLVRLLTPADIFTPA
jgi:transcriptional regulator with XRE-family HTH domain